MNLDQLLGSMSVDQLQDLMAAWAPDEPMSSSKQALFRVLRDQMVRPDRVRHCLDGCGKLERGIVRKLLRSEGASQSVAVLAVSSAERPKSIDDTRSAVAELVALGLAAVGPEKRWEAYGSARVAVPDELVGPLREATGIDGRSWQELLGLADYLASLPERELGKRLKKLGLDHRAETSADSLAAELARPGACGRRLDALSQPLRELVLAATHTRAGIVPVERSHELGVTLPGIDDSVLAAWRRELETGFIGTIGDVSLLDYGIALDGKVLVVFAEVAEALVSVPYGEEFKPADPVGPDFLLDVSELVSAVREFGAKLKASGALTSAAANHILAKLNRPGLPQTDAHDLLELLVACAEKLGLVERGGDTLIARPSAWKWECRSYGEKAAELFELIGFAVPTPRSKHHHEVLCEVACGLLRSMKPGEWRRGGSLVNVALRRYLAGLQSSDLRVRIADAVHEVAEYVLPPFPGLDQLRADLHESVVMEAYAMGVLDLAVDGGRVVGEGLSLFGSVAAGLEAADLPPAKLITTPDFEVIILPEGDTTRLRYQVGQFAASEKFEQTRHLRITKERVEEAVVRGLSADDMIRLLCESSQTGTVVQNVEYSIRGWAERVRVATVAEVHVFELPDERLLDVIAELPDLKKLIVRRISPTALALSEWPSDRKLLADLCRLGVYVR